MGVGVGVVFPRPRGVPAGGPGPPRRKTREPAGHCGPAPRDPRSGHSPSAGAAGDGQSRDRVREGSGISRIGDPERPEIPRISRIPMSGCPGITRTHINRSWISQRPRIPRIRVFRCPGIPRTRDPGHPRAQGSRGSQRPRYPKDQGRRFLDVQGSGIPGIPRIKD